MMKGVPYRMVQILEVRKIGQERQGCWQAVGAGLVPSHRLGGWHTRAPTTVQATQERFGNRPRHETLSCATLVYAMRNDVYIYTYMYIYQYMKQVMQAITILKKKCIRNFLALGQWCSLWFKQETSAQDHFCWWWWLQSSLRRVA